MVSSSAIAGLATSIFKLQKHPINTSKIGDLTLITSSSNNLFANSILYISTSASNHPRHPESSDYKLHLTEKYIIDLYRSIRTSIPDDTHLVSHLFRKILVLLRDLDCEAFMHEQRFVLAGSALIKIHFITDPQGEKISLFPWLRPNPGSSSPVAIKSYLDLLPVHPLWAASRLSTTYSLETL